MDRSKDINTWETFICVASAGSISGACGLCNTDAANISRTISSLEKSLGNVKLFNRSTRPFTLTESGKIALEYARQMVQAHNELLSQLNSDTDTMIGTIRVGFPPQVFEHFLMPFVIKFNEMYPNIKLVVSEFTSKPPIHFENNNRTLDIIVAYGPDSNRQGIVQIKYGQGILIPCASPQYLERHPLPTHPAQLIEHEGIVFSSSMRSQARALKMGDEICEMRFAHTIEFSSADAAKIATLMGAGIHPGIPSLHCYQEIDRGELVPLFTDWESEPLQLYIYVRPESLRLKRVKTFIDAYRREMNRIHTRCESVINRVFQNRLMITHSQ